MSAAPGLARSEAVIDLDAIRHNTATLVELARGAAVMAVVKADGYGHGLLPAARAAVAGGASWLGVAFPEEALALRAGGLEVPVLAWLFGPQDDLSGLVSGQVDLGVYSVAELARAEVAARTVGRPARVHLKVDTGLTRGGATSAEWPTLCAAAARAQAAGTVEVLAVWSHLACAEGGPQDPVTVRQNTLFQEAIELARGVGLRPPLRHLANSAATLSAPSTHYDLVRPGVAIYGLCPLPGRRPADLGLRPAMTVRSTVVLTKTVPAGTGVSYQHRHTTTADTTIALVPLGYADGVPRAATGVVEVLLTGRRRRIAGTVCMDQFLLDTGGEAVEVGAEVVLFGSGEQGEPLAQDWAEALGTIDYEVVTRIGARVRRRQVGGT